jgi:hypothetical protein
VESRSAGRVLVRRWYVGVLGLAVVAGFAAVAYGRDHATADASGEVNVINGHPGQPGQWTDDQAPLTGPCPLSAGAAAEACWATHTGVRGYTEAQILSGASPLKHVTGNVTVRTDGAVISNEWIDGCIAVKANDVTIQDVLVHTRNRCKGGDSTTKGSAIDSGGDDAAVRNLHITDTEVDGMGADVDSNGIGTVSFSCLRCNVHGFTKDVWLSTGSSIVDSYLHDTSMSGGTHTEPVMIDGGSGVSVLHSYVKSPASNNFTTGAVGMLADYGGVSHVVVDSNYLEGGQGWDVSGGSTTAAYIVIVNNALSPVNGWGGTDFMTYFSPGNTGNVWKNNYNSQTTAPITP